MDITAQQLKLAFCPYCGCSCKFLMQYGPSGYIEKILPDNNDPISQGKPCIKGLSVHEMLSVNRVTKPMIRRKKGGELEVCSWDQAFEFIKSHLKELNDGSEDWSKLRNVVYFTGAGETTNEANYVLSKISRCIFNSNNIDSCARLCHAATGVAFDKIFGIKAIPQYTMDDVAVSDCFFFVGSDPIEDYPVFGNRITSAKNNGAKLITVDVAGSGTSAVADLNVNVSPFGIVPFLAHIIVELVKQGDCSRDAKNLEGYAEFVSSAEQIALETPLSEIGVAREDFEKVVWMLSKAKKITVGFGMGLTQHVNGTQNAMVLTGLSILLNAMLFPNRGKVNVQGAGDMGADPFWEINSKLSASQLKSKGWDVKWQDHKGNVMTEKLYDDDIKFVWMLPSNLLQSMPDLNALEKSFSKKFIVYQHHHISRTMEWADVVLPSLVLSEEWGTVTNGERRVRGLFTTDRKLTIGEGTAGPLSNLDVLLAFAKYMNFEGFDYQSINAVTEELLEVNPGYSTVKITELETEQGYLADKNFKHRVLFPIKYERSHFQTVDQDFPFVLTTARNRFHFCTGDGTRCSQTLSKLAGEPVVLVNPLDAEALRISDGDIVKITSRVGEIMAKISINSQVGKRVLVAPFHFDKLLVNRLTPRVLDNDSKTPCYKEVNVTVSK